MYRKYRIVESIASSVSQYESYRDQVYRYTPRYDPVICDVAFEIFRITCLPQSSLVVSNIRSTVDVASCRYEPRIVSSTTALTSQCYTMMTSLWKHKFLKSWVEHIKRCQNHG